MGPNDFSDSESVSSVVAAVIDEQPAAHRGGMLGDTTGLYATPAA
jgi:hypothetical protein